ncbi:Uncharacterised protein [Chryseobacterium nakagawai]|uniref:Uncharacterized protein n=1 Tax=Chryseobacterium nakagawai TaxID=1241982 RepID=A0AAD0YL18_CHRNA|nr:hypothetical protein [Chryseobacterium nakagawai]AZA91777.1 hypothetical protein EG343_14705 [Chryseobacterium nakagawai]VEH18287.1 Uncharacterised protein [Chryseobacterium nakagawai]
MKYIMLKLSEKLKKNFGLFNMKNLSGLSFTNRTNKNSLQTNNQTTTSYKYKLDSTSISTEKMILNLVEFKNKFLSENEVFHYLSTTIKEENFSQKKINSCLEKLEKEKRIYEYRIPKTHKSIWGQACWLDHNMIPKKAYINNPKYRDAIQEYKRQCNLA